jgi:hypothetical protein
MAAKKEVVALVESIELDGYARSKSGGVKIVRAYDPIMGERWEIVSFKSEPKTKTLDEIVKYLTGWKRDAFAGLEVVAPESSVADDEKLDAQAEKTRERIGLKKESADEKNASKSSRKNRRPVQQEANDLPKRRWVAKGVELEPGEIRRRKAKSTGTTMSVYNVEQTTGATREMLNPELGAYVAVERETMKSAYASSFSKAKALAISGEFTKTSK